ncbi:MAG: OmpH family outer membrane protein [bacterium]
MKKKNSRSGFKVLLTIQLALAAGVLVGFSFFRSSMGECAEKTKQGYFDYKKIIDMSETGKKMKTSLQYVKEKKQKNYNELVDSIKKKKEELEKKGFALQSEAKIKIEEEIRRGELDAKRMFEDGQVELTNIEKKELIKFNEKLQKIIDKVGQEDGYLFIYQMNGSGIVYADPQYDITNKIAEVLDKQRK